MESNRPSKQFIIRGSIALGVLLLLLLSQTKWVANLFHTKAEPLVATTPQTVGDLVGKDSNQNGIADWEERLWGLDPTVSATNGVSNKQIIEEKKKALGVPQGAIKGDSTDSIAQQLFTISTALSQSDEVTDATLSDIGGKLGAAVDIKAVKPLYSLKDLHAVPTTHASLTAYAAALAKTTATFDTNAPDIDVVISALQNEDYSQIESISGTANVYFAMAKSLKTLSVPIALERQHLSLMNGLTGIAQSFQYLAQINDNNVNGLAGVGIYKAASLQVSQALLDIHNYLVTYGIL